MPAIIASAPGPDLPPALCDVVLRCLSKDREQRHANAEDRAAGTSSSASCGPVAAAAATSCGYPSPANRAALTLAPEFPL